MKKILSGFFLTVLFITTAHASDVTHLLGTTGYMLREAIWVHADTKDPENYHKAVDLQYQAKAAFRGNRKQGRNLDDTVELTKQAYEFAKLARDNSQPWPYANSLNNFYKSIEKVKKTKNKK